MELRNGSNVVNYEYEFKQRKTKVVLNGETAWTVQYVDDPSANRTGYDTVKATNAKGEVLVNVTQSDNPDFCEMIASLTTISTKSISSYNGKLAFGQPTRPAESFLSECMTEVKRA